jgi:acyl-coenzyme A thioesterase PaaI-like protein
MQERDESMTQESDDSPRHLCYGCGVKNPEGLKVEFEVDGSEVRGVFNPRWVHQGFPGVAHGGIGAAVMDEAMGWAMYAAGAWAMTARLEVRYRRPLPLDETISVGARVVRDRGKRLEATAELRDSSGALLAQAKGLFLRMPDQQQEELNETYLGTA